MKLRLHYYSGTGNHNIIVEDLLVAQLMREANINPFSYEWSGIAEILPFDDESLAYFSKENGCNIQHAADKVAKKAPLFHRELRLFVRKKLDEWSGWEKENLILVESSWDCKIPGGIFRDEIQYANYRDRLLLSNSHYTMYDDPHPDDGEYISWIKEQNVPEHLNGISNFYQITMVEDFQIVGGKGHDINEKVSKVLPVLKEVYENNRNEKTLDSFIIQELKTKLQL